MIYDLFLSTKVTMQKKVFFSRKIKQFLLNQAVSDYIQGIGNWFNFAKL